MVKTQAFTLELYFHGPVTCICDYESLTVNSVESILVAWLEPVNVYSDCADMQFKLGCLYSCIHFTVQTQTQTQLCNVIKTIITSTCIQSMEKCKKTSLV